MEKKRCKTIGNGVEMKVWEMEGSERRCSKKEKENKWERRNEKGKKKKEDWWKGVRERK